ncbi:hypothetical protein [Alloprevotella sp. OH1205_COT-284]|nr:hypothetical protein [Alloprevotella sp. OH1205_COT-284]
MAFTTFEIEISTPKVEMPTSQAGVFFRMTPMPDRTAMEKNDGDSVEKWR